MSDTTNHTQIAASLTHALQLQQPPVAISFADSIPSGTREHAGSVPAGCRFWQEATTASFATSSTDHSLCAIGVYTHNLQSTPPQQADLVDALKVFGQLEYVREADIPSIPVLQSQPKYIVYSPLRETLLPPDVVLLFVNASQMLILSEAAHQVENHPPPAMGRPACAVVPQAMNSGKAALSLGCCGARAYLDILSDEVALFAIPGAKLEEYVQRIDALVKANAILSSFHQLRRRDVQAGRKPTVKESLAATGA